MKKGYKGIIIALIAVLVICLIYTFLLKAELIRNYHIKDFIIDVNIDKTGDIRVKEDTLYRFNGTYNGITITIPTNVTKEYYKNLTKDSMNDSKELPDSLYNCNGIEDVKIYVSENGQNRYFNEVEKANNGDRNVYTVIEENGFTTFKIYEPSVSTDKRIIIEYTLKDIVVQHNDVAELFWNFIGGEVQCKIENLKINIYGENILKAYTHGNMTGDLKNKIDKIQITYKNIKPYEFVSARVILDWNIQNIAKQNNIVAMPIIEKLEDSYSDKKQVMVNFIKVAIIMSVAIFTYWILLLVRYEREIEPIPLVMDDMEILEKYNPMIAACIAQNRGMHPRDILAVLIDLVNIKALKMVHIVGSVVGTKQDMYKLIKNEEFFSDDEKVAKLDYIQQSIISIFFGKNNEIELTKKLKEIKKDTILANYFKTLDSTVADRLDEIGANYQSVPKGIRVFNTLSFIMIIVYVIVMIAYSNTLDYVTLSVVDTELFEEVLYAIPTIIGILFILLPLILVLLKVIVKLINVIRVAISKVAYKLSNKKLTRTLVILLILFSLIIIAELLFLKKSNLIIATILILSGLLVVVTDNLMTSHTRGLSKEYMMLKQIQYKIEEGSLLNEKQIKDNLLWGKYFTFAVALGVADVAEYVKYIPDTLNMLEAFDDITEGGFNLYNLERELSIKDKLESFENKIDSINRKLGEGASSGFSSSSSRGSFSSGRSFGSGGGRFSGGGGHGGGRGAF